MKRILYITYDSINAAISQSQIIPLLNSYSKKNKLFLISFEKEKKKIIQNLDQNIIHIQLKFRKNHLSRLFSFIFYVFYLIFFVFKNKIEIVHTRSYLPNLLVLLIKPFKKIKIIFDIRGFWFDEKYEAKKLNILSYQILKKIEKALFEYSDVIVTLSKISKQIICDKFKVDEKIVHVIPTFTNFSNFTDKTKLTKKNKIIFGYVGNMGMNYEFDKVITFLKNFDKINKSWELIIANDQIKNKLFKKKIHFKNNIKFKNFKFNNMNKFYSNIDICIYFLNTKYSKKASCPTKLGELIATNTPFITNSGIGDINKIYKKLNSKIFLIDKNHLISFIEINKAILEYKNKKLMYNSRIKLKNFFSENLNLIKYIKIIENL